MAEQKRYRAFNFDLAAKKLDELLPGGHQTAYTELKRFLLGKGFVHRQQSGYASQTALSTLDVRDILDEMGRVLPWLHGCVNRFEVTDVNRNTDMTFVFMPEDDFEDQDFIAEGDFGFSFE